MTWHVRCRDENEKIIHPAEGMVWQHFVRTYPDFAFELRNVRLGLCTDGFSPFGQSASPYSRWLIFLIVYNLPPSMCTKPKYIFLSLIISSPQSPRKNIDVMLRPLIDELKQLWAPSVRTMTASAIKTLTRRQLLCGQSVTVMGMVCCQDGTLMGSCQDETLMGSCHVHIVWKTPRLSTLTMEVMDNPSKMKDNVKVRMDIKEVCKRKELWIIEEDTKLKATYVLSKDQRKSICRGVVVDQNHHLLDINPKSKLRTYEPFILTSQAQQVYYTQYPSMNSRRKGWWVVIKTKVRRYIEMPLELLIEQDEDEAYFQDNDPPIPQPTNVDVITFELIVHTNGTRVEIVEEDQNNDVEENDSDDEEVEFDSYKTSEEENNNYIL
ncbi:hypothetical protein SLEP1_g44111 [Rubroshorea leprosula]|uniref:DUF4216 domain-containing protein n=1 Tax=Rubroshorea leprosula TaxID=152421 RepID=A0AAV5LFI8_9ROSI|nr:hypothetical protein SLEP1_g44111 [Rubroshorea leprosula]